MRKKLFMFLAMCSCIAMTTAETYRAAVINLKSGGAANYALEGVSISLNQGKVIVASDKASAEWNLSEVESFEVKEVEVESTSLEDVSNFYVVFNSKENLLEVTNYSGEVDFLSPSGRLVKSFRVDRSASIHLSDLPQSIYVCVFRANGQTIKIITQ